MVTVKDILQRYGSEKPKYMGGLKPEEVESYSLEEVRITEGTLDNFGKGYSEHLLFGCSRLGTLPSVKSGFL